MRCGIASVSAHPLCSISSSLERISAGQLEAEVARLRTRETEASSPATPTHPHQSATFPAVSLSPTSGSIIPRPIGGLLPVNLSESISATFRLATGLDHPQTDPQHRITVETFLRGLAIQHPDVYPPGSASALSYGVPGTYNVTESSSEWGLARTAMARMLSLHLVQCEPARVFLVFRRVLTPLAQPSSRHAVPTCRSSCRGSTGKSGSSRTSMNSTHRLGSPSPPSARWGREPVHIRYAVLYCHRRELH